MGMSASQVRLLTITKRIHEVENEAERTQNQKMLLGLQSDEAYEEYLAAMEMKNIEYAWFNGDTGNFEWDKLTIQSLFDNGYHLKVKQIAPQPVQNSLTHAVSNIMSGYTGTTSISGIPNSGAVYLPNAATSHYTFNLTGGTVNPAITNMSQLSDLFINNPNLQANGLLDSNFTADSTIDSHQATANSVFAPGSTDFASTYTFYIDNNNFNAFLQSVVNCNDYQGRTVYLIDDITTYAYCYNTFGYFNGTLDGNGHTISNLHSPLFNSLQNATIKNLKIDGAETANSAGNDAGLIAVNCQGLGSNIQNCSITNSNITKSGNVGGFVANVDYGILNISNSYITGTTIQTTGNDSYAGDFVGDIGNSGYCNVDNAYSISTVSAVDGTHTGFIGGAPGNNAHVNITSTYTNNSSAIGYTNNSAYVYTTPMSYQDTIQLGIAYQLPGQQAQWVTLDLENTDTPQTIAVKIQNKLNEVITSDPNFSVNYNNGQYTITNTDNSGNYSMSIYSTSFNNVLDIADLLGLGFYNPTITNPVNYDNFTGSLNFKINNQDVSIDLSQISTLDDVANGIQTQIDTVLGTPGLATVTITNNQLTVDIDPNYSVTFSDFAETSNYSAQNTLTNVLGLQTLFNQQQQYTSPDYQFYECSSPAEVLQHLGSGVDINDPLVLRELIYNAYAIIMAPIYDEDLGHSIMQETSVATNVGLREKTDNAQLAQAEANYEAALRRIDKKEEQYDKDLAKYDQERKALTSELDTLKTCIKENVDRTFKIFQG